MIIQKLNIYKLRILLNYLYNIHLRYNRYVKIKLIKIKYIFPSKRPLNTYYMKFIEKSKDIFVINIYFVEFCYIFIYS